MGKIFQSLPPKKLPYLYSDFEENFKRSFVDFWKPISLISVISLVIKSYCENHLGSEGRDVARFLCLGGGEVSGPKKVFRAAKLRGKFFGPSRGSGDMFPDPLENF